MAKYKKIIVAILILADIGILIFGNIHFIRFANYYSDTWNIDILTYLVYMAPYFVVDLLIFGIILKMIRSKKKPDICNG